MCSIRLIRYFLPISLNNLQLDAPHAALLDSFDFENETVVLHYFSGLEHMPVFSHHKPADGHVRVRVRHREFYTPVKVAHGESTVKKVVMPIDLGDLFIYFFIVFVGNVADNLFQKIFQSNDAFESAMFVDYETKMHLYFLHLA